MARYGKPEIFNTDQGSQFTSPRFVDVLLDAGVRVSMDGKGRWMDNVFIERLWRSLKIRVRLHPCAQSRHRIAGRASETGSRLLQCRPTALGPWRGDPR